MEEYTIRKDELEILKEENARLKEELERKEKILDKLIDVLHGRGKSHLTIYKKPE